MALVAIPFFLCWGSFLNVLGYRLVRGESFVLPRSKCPCCQALIVWHDNIPVVSWIILRGKCRSCKNNISVLYPFIELFTALVMGLMTYLVPPQFWFSYFIFFSALIVTIRSDLETMLISRFVTLLLIPVGYCLSLVGLLQISFFESLAGSLFGYVILWLICKLFFALTKKEGMGQGDLELLAFIGSFTGVVGSWISLTIGSIIGSLIGLGYLLFTNQGRYTKIPFGPFLALGAICFVCGLNFLLNTALPFDQFNELVQFITP